MKKASVMFMVLALCAAGVFGVNSLASAQPGWGGHHYYSNVDPETQAFMQKHWDTVTPLRQQLYAKQAELDMKISSGASSEEVNDIVKDINILDAKLNDAHVRMRQEMTKRGIPYAGRMNGYSDGYRNRGGRGCGHGGHGGGCCWW